MSIIVIPAAAQAAANAAAGEQTFTVPLYTRTDLTHYWCGWAPPDDVLAALQQVGATVHRDDPDAVLADLGLSRDPVDRPKTAAEIAAEHATIETIADMEAFRAALEQLRRLRGDVKAWVGTAPANNNQRDKRIDDLANVVLALTQRLNLLEGTTDADDLVDPGALEAL